MSNVGLINCFWIKFLSWTRNIGINALITFVITSECFGSLVEFCWISQDTIWNSIIFKCLLLHIWKVNDNLHWLPKNNRQNGDLCMSKVIDMIWNLLAKWSWLLSHFLSSVTPSKFSFCPLLFPWGCLFSGKFCSKLLKKLTKFSVWTVIIFKLWWCQRNVSLRMVDISSRLNAFK